MSRLSSPRLAVLSTLALLAPARASRCNGEATPGPRNLLPIDAAPPVLVASVPNGKLFRVGQGDDAKDLVHVWGAPRERGLAMGQLQRAKIVAFLPAVYA